MACVRLYLVKPFLYARLDCGVSNCIDWCVRHAGECGMVCDLVIHIHH